MKGTTRFAATLVAVLTLTLLALGAGTAKAHAASSCGIVSAAHHSWIVVAKGVPCSTATGVLRSFAARTAALHTGARVVVRSSLAGFTCVLASQGKPGGSCSTPGAAKSILWIFAV